MNGFIAYYLITFAYCLYMSARKWNRDVRAGGLGITPGLDTMAIMIMCWILAPIDVFLTWTRVYREAEEVRRKHADTDNSLDGMSSRDGKVF